MHLLNAVRNAQKPGATGNRMIKSNAIKTNKVESSPEDIRMDKKMGWKEGGKEDMKQDKKLAKKMMKRKKK